MISDRQYANHAKLRRYRANCAEFQRTMDSKQDVDGASRLDECIDSPNWGVGVKILKETYCDMIEFGSQDFKM